MTTEDKKNNIAKRPLTLQILMQHQQTPTPPPPPAQRPSNIERIAQWREIAERSGNAKLINTVDILEIRYANEVTLAHYNGRPINLYVDILEIRHANEATRPPTPTLKGGAK